MEATKPEGPHVRIVLSRLMLHIVPTSPMNHAALRALTRALNRYTQGEFLVWSETAMTWVTNPESDGREAGILQGAQAEPDGDGNIAIEVFLPEESTDPPIAEVLAALYAWLLQYDAHMQVSYGPA